MPFAFFAMVACPIVDNSISDVSFIFNTYLFCFFKIEGYSIDEVANIVAFGFFKRYKLDAFHFIIMIYIVKLLVHNAYTVVCGSKESLVSPF